MTGREVSKEHRQLIGRRTFPHLMQRIKIRRTDAMQRAVHGEASGTGGIRRRQVPRHSPKRRPIGKHRETCDETAVMMEKACDLHL